MPLSVFITVLHCLSCQLPVSCSRGSLVGIEWCCSRSAWENKMFSLKINDVMWWALNKSYIQSHVYCQCTFNLQIESSSSEALYIGVKGFLVFNEQNPCCAAGVVWPPWPEDSSRVGFFYLVMERWQMHLTFFFYNDLDIRKMQYLQYIGQGRTDNFFPLESLNVEVM